MMKKPSLRHISYGTTVMVQFFCGNIWQELEPIFLTKMDPEPKINNFGSATHAALKGHYSETKFSGVLYSLQYIHKKMNNIDI